MPDPETLRDSTEIVLPCETLDGLRGDLTERFAVSVFAVDGRCRIVGSPVAIRRASQFLTRNGIGHL